MKLPESSKPQRMKKDWHTINRGSSSGFMEADVSATSTMIKWITTTTEINFTFCSLFGPTFSLVTSRKARCIKQNEEVRHGKAIPKRSSVIHCGSCTPFSLDSYGSNNKYTDLVNPSTRSITFMATNNGLRANPLLWFTITMATKEWTATKPNMIPNPTQCSSHAKPQIFFAIGQSGPGSATAAVVGCSTDLLLKFDISDKGLQIKHKNAHFFNVYFHRG